MPTIKVDLKKCIICGKCYEICPKIIYNPVEIDGKIKFLPTRAEFCLFCCTCVSSCPEEAISVKKKKFRDQIL